MAVPFTLYLKNTILSFLFLFTVSLNVSSQQVTLDSLIKQSKHPNENRRLDAVYELGNIGSAAVPTLVDLLEDPAMSVRLVATRKLGDIGPQAELAIPALINILKRSNSFMTVPITHALGNIGAPAIPALARALKDSDAGFRARAAEALGEAGGVAASAVPDLILALKDSDPYVRSSAATALSSIGAPGLVALPDLTAALRDSHPAVRSSAASAIGNFGPSASPAVPALITTLKDSDDHMRWSAAVALEAIGPKASRALPSLIAAINDSFPIVSQQAITAIASIGGTPFQAMPAFIDAVKNSNLETREAAAKGLQSLSYNLSKSRNTISLDTLNSYIIPKLEQAYNIIHQDSTIKANVDISNNIETSLNLLKYAYKERKKNPFNWLLTSTEKYPLVTAILSYLAICLFLWFLLLWLHPISLIRINDKLRQFAVSIQYLDSISLRTVTLVAFFNYHPRVLDAWIEENAENTRTRFGRRSTVNDRQVFVSIPTILDDKALTELTPNDIKPIFSSTRFCLLIKGEGGSGKTSLACQIADWASEDDAAKRLTRHRMLPVLIEDELTFGEKGQRLVNSISGHLKDLLAVPEMIDNELLLQLLRQRRILVIIDHLSECSDETRGEIRPDTAEFPINALIVTSRVDEPLGNITRNTLTPLRIEGNRLSRFIDAFLTQRNKRELFTDVEYFDSCRQLTEMVRTRNITVLLAKLFAQQMIAVKEDIHQTELPRNIPELMLRYVNELNRNVKTTSLPNREVLKCAQIVAWECLKQTFLPGPADREMVIKALNDPSAESQINYLTERLRLLQIVGEDGQRIGFALDPIAEYLAAMHLVHITATDDSAWRAFVIDLQKKSAGSKNLSGFVLALQDCIANKVHGVTVPEWLEAEIAFSLESNVPAETISKQVS